MGFFSPPTITDFVRSGDLDGVRRRLELGDDVNERRSFSTTPLLEAAQFGYWAIIELLLDHGADMELVHFNEYTALHMAIDFKKVDAALLLARRGACANNIGYLGRTPLQCAVKRNLLQVTAELLAHGADPMVRSRSGKIAKDYIQFGPSQAEFETLLNAYTDLDSAIRFRNVSAIGVCLNKALTGTATAPISSIDAAIQLKQTDALMVILEMSLTSETLETKIFHHNLLRAGATSVVEPDWRDALVCIADDFTNQLLEQVTHAQDFELLKKLVRDVDDPAWIQNVRFENGWTALHLAASLDNYAFVHYLLIDCGLNPLVCTSDGTTARDLALLLNENSAVSWLLLQHMKKMTFSEQAALLLSSKELTADNLRGLVGQITTVSDLRVIFSLGFQNLSNDEMHTVLTEAFDEIIREKLVFDNDAAVFFRVGLQECRRQNYISEVELIEWDLKAIKVNVENSDWVRDIKQSLQQVECRVTACERGVEILHSQFGRLRDVLIQREKNEIKQRERQRYVSLLSSALIMCGGPAIKELFGAAFDLWDPAQLLSVLSADDVADFLAEAASTIVFKDGVELMLADASVNPAEFAAVLRDAVKCDHVETMKAETLFSPPTDTSSEITPTRRNYRFKAAVHDVLRRIRNEEATENAALVDGHPGASSVQTADPSSLLGMSEADMVAYPYHYAVKFSDGDINRFLELVQYIDEDDGEINETLTIYVRPNGSSSEWEEVVGSALIYASYLGYVEIVKWFLEHDAVKVTEKKFSTMKRSHSSSKTINDVCIKKSAESA